MRFRKSCKSAIWRFALLEYLHVLEVQRLSHTVTTLCAKRRFAELQEVFCGLVFLCYRTFARDEKTVRCCGCCGGSRCWCSRTTCLVVLSGSAPSDLWALSRDDLWS